MARVRPPKWSRDELEKQRLIAQSEFIREREA
jgi:hypothetical protein